MNLDEFVRHLATFRSAECEDGVYEIIHEPALSGKNEMVHLLPRFNDIYLHAMSFDFDSHLSGESRLGVLKQFKRAVDDGSIKLIK